MTYNQAHNIMMNKIKFNWPHIFTVNVMFDGERTHTQTILSYVQPAKSINVHQTKIARHRMYIEFYEVTIKIDNTFCKRH